MKKKYKISILGGYGLKNFGDDALMYVIYKNMKKIYTDSQISFICTNSSYLKNIVNDCDIISLEEKDSVNTNILVYGGGTQFYSFKSKPNIYERVLLIIKDPLNIHKRIIKKVFKRKKKDIYEDKKICALGIGVGPFLKHSNKCIEQETRELFKKMDYISVRDTFSVNKCKEWGLEKVKHHADLCYLMDNEFRLKKKDSINNIGIIVRDWNQTVEGSTYYDKIFLLLDLLKEEGYNVDIIIFSKKRDLYWSQKLKEKDNVLYWDPDIDSIKNFILSLNNYDLFITARYHGAVFSTILGKPFISIEVEQKLKLISLIYNKSSRNWTFPFNVNECLDYVRTIDSNYLDCVNNVIKENKNQKKLANEMIKTFVEYITM